MNKAELKAAYNIIASVVEAAYSGMPAGPDSLAELEAEIKRSINPKKGDLVEVDTPLGTMQGICVREEPLHVMTEDERPLLLLPEEGETVVVSSRVEPHRLKKAEDKYYDSIQKFGV